MAEILDDKASSLVSSTCIGCSSYIGYKQIDWILIQIDGKYLENIINGLRYFIVSYKKVYIKIREIKN